MRNLVIAGIVIAVLGGLYGLRLLGRSTGAALIIEGLSVVAVLYGIVLLNLVGSRQ